MSNVKASDRKPNRLEVFLKTRQLCIYTLTITANEKVFPAQFYRSMTSRLEALAVRIHEQCWKANNIMAKSAEGMAARKALQDSAIADCQAFLALLDVAKGLFHLASKRVEYWTGLIIETRNLIRGWRESDTKRSKGM